ncbi:hypothetical protein ACFE04_007133 [Oxalis oulophora]
MDMAEKDDSDGRCPACRSPYDKEKIVGTAANCERLVAEVSWERKKSKAKPKSTDGRKQLSSVRVVQRNLVYIVGLPLNLADEELLQRREYFGQYGKVLKVSMSRTAAGVVQQFPNNTCSVYITYSKEEEAVRCIQSVHGFVLEGKTLKGCFGTTKYCHAWLRNVPCTNHDCLYLHEVGSHEDSFTKDEIISAYTRNRVQQITGATNNLQRRAGSVLPPPIDDYCIDTFVSTAKPIVKTATNQSSTINPTKSSPPNGSFGKSPALPAAASWGTRALNQPSIGSSASSSAPCKQKPETLTNNTLAFSTAVTNTAQVSSGNEGKKLTLKDESLNTHVKGKPDVLKPLKQHAGVDFQTATPEKASATDIVSIIPSNVEKTNKPSNVEKNNKPSNVEKISDHTEKKCPEKEKSDATEMLELCSDVLSMSIDTSPRKDSASGSVHNSSLPDQGLIKSSMEHCVWGTDSRTQAPLHKNSEAEDDILFFDNQRLKDPEVTTCSSYLPNLSSHSRSHSLQYSEAFAPSNNGPLFVDNNKASQSSFLHSSVLSNGYHENFVNNSASGSYQNFENSFPFSNERRGRHADMLHSDSDTGENNIISNLLSMDLNVWDQPLASPQNFAELLGGSEKQQPSSWTQQQSNNQSRFSFARQEDSRNQVSELEQSFSIFGQLPNGPSFNSNLAEHHRDLPMGNFGVGNNFASSNFESESFITSPSVLPSKRFSVSRSQMSAPPGFAIPHKAPPPGFSSHERMDQAFDSAGNHLFDNYSLSRNSYQLPPTGNINSPTGDIEFMDPAILAVGKGRLHQGGINNNTFFDTRSNFPSQLNTFENEARLQLLMQQRSPSSHQGLGRISDYGENFSSHNDSYGIGMRMMDQSQASNHSPFITSQQPSRNPVMSNGHWDSWNSNEVQSGNNLGGVVDILRNDRLGYNKFYSGYEDTKFRMPNSGDSYNRTFGIAIVFVFEEMGVDLELISVDSLVKHDELLEQP